jgi:hypothetical protein
MIPQRCPEKKKIILFNFSSILYRKHLKFISCTSSHLRLCIGNHLAAIKVFEGQITLKQYDYS